jgi:hypothetical protein
MTHPNAPQNLKPPVLTGAPIPGGALPASVGQWVGQAQIILLQLGCRRLGAPRHRHQLLAVDI